MRLWKHTMHLLALLVAQHRTQPRDGLLVSCGFVIATATLAIMLAIPAGIERITGNTGQPDIAIVLSSGTLYEATSSLNAEQFAILSQLPAVARNADGRALAAAQFVANTRLTRPDGKSALVMVRGSSAEVWEMLGPAARIEGPLHAGTRQLFASQALRDQFPALRQPQVRLQGQEWTLTGTFESGGNLWESEIWADLSALQAAYNRPGAISSVWLKLTSAEAMGDLQQAIHADLRLDGLFVRDQPGYYQDRVGNIAHFARAMAVAVSLLLGIGACLVISAMLSIVLARRRQQMATLRALGFERHAVGLAHVLDTLLIGSICALCTTLLAWWWLDGVSFGAANAQQAVYARFVVDAEVALSVLGYSVLLGLVSAVLPLRRALRGSLVSALQD